MSKLPFCSCQSTARLCSVCAREQVILDLRANLRQAEHYYASMLAMRNASYEENARLWDYIHALEETPED